MILLLLACTAGPGSDSGTPDSGTPDTGAPTPACWGDREPGTVEVIVAGFEDGTEGLAFSQGRLFVTAGTDIVEILPDGTTALLWRTDHTLGLAPFEDGLLLADPGVFSFGGDEDGEIWRVPLAGEPTLVSSGWSNPNFLAPTPWGTVLMADDTEDGLVDISLDDGSGVPWMSDVPSPNGIVLWDDRVTVASTFVSEGEVYQAVVSEGVAGPSDLFAQTVAGGANDGMAAGWADDVWVAVNLAGEIWQIDSQGNARSFAAGLDTPASLAFGEGEDWDPCSLYVTSLFGEEVVRLVVAAD